LLPDAPAHAARKAAICARHGTEARPPLNEDVARLAERDEATAWRTIFAKDVAMREAADLAIINLTPFRGASADAGTLVELGWFLGRARPVFAYSNTATLFAARSGARPDAGADRGRLRPARQPHDPGRGGAAGGAPLLLPERFDSLEMFERCVVLAAERYRSTSSTAMPNSARPSESRSPSPSMPQR
jgi:hypothetical protein